MDMIEKLIVVATAVLKDNNNTQMKHRRKIGDNVFCPFSALSVVETSLLGVVLKIRKLKANAQKNLTMKDRQTKYPMKNFDKLS